MKITKAEKEVEVKGLDVIENEFIKIVPKDGREITSIAMSVKLDGMNRSVGLHAGKMNEIPNRAEEMLCGIAATFRNEGMSDEDCLELITAIAKKALIRVSRAEVKATDIDDSVTNLEIRM